MSATTISIISDCVSFNENVNSQTNGLAPFSAKLTYFKFNEALSPSKWRQDTAINKSISSIGCGILVADEPIAVYSSITGKKGLLYSFFPTSEFERDYSDESQKFFKQAEKTNRFVFFVYDDKEALQDQDATKISQIWVHEKKGPCTINESSIINTIHALGMAYFPGNSKELKFKKAKDGVTFSPNAFLIKELDITKVKIVPISENKYLELFESMGLDKLCNRDTPEEKKGEVADNNASLTTSKEIVASPSNLQSNTLSDIPQAPALNINSTKAIRPPIPKRELPKSPSSVYLTNLQPMKQASPPPVKQATPLPTKQSSKPPQTQVNSNPSMQLAKVITSPQTNRLRSLSESHKKPSSDSNRSSDPSDTATQAPKKKSFFPFKKG
jgi:hypothetical protein